MHEPKYTDPRGHISVAYLQYASYAGLDVNISADQALAEANTNINRNQVVLQLDA